MAKAAGMEVMVGCIILIYRYINNFPPHPYSSVIVSNEGVFYEMQLSLIIDKLWNKPVFDW